MSGRSDLLAATLLVAAGCSATRFEHDPCTADSQCRASFGFGAICQEGGFCGPAPLAGCDRSFPDDLLGDPVRYRDSVVLASLTDRSSPTQVIRERAIRLAFQEANARGGLEGRPVGVVMCDVQGGQAVERARLLAERLRVPAILGPASSLEVQAVWAAIEGTGTMILSPSATSEALAQLQPDVSDAEPGLLWTAAPADGLQARAIAEDMLARGVARAYLLRESGLYGENLARLVADRLQEGGGSVQIAPVSSDLGIAGATAAVPSEQDGEVLFISSQPTWIVKFLQAASLQPGYDRRTIFLTEAAASPTVLEAAGVATALFPRIRGTRLAPLDPGDATFASFVAGYRAEYGGEDPTEARYAAHAYDAAWLALYGAAWSALQEREVAGPGMARGLRRLGNGAATPMVPASWQAALAAFRAGRSVDVRGASGTLDYDAGVRSPAGSIQLWGVTSADGRFTATAIEGSPSP